MNQYEKYAGLANEVIEGITQGVFAREIIPEKYTYEHLFSLFVMRRQLDGGSELYQVFYDWIMGHNEAKIKQKCARGEKITIVFLAISAAEWGAEKIYHMLKQDNRVECYVVVSPLMDRDLESRRDGYYQNVDFFKRNGYEVRGRCNDEFNEVATWQELGGMPDIVIHSTSWFAALPAMYQVINFPLSCLNYYIPYGVYLAENDMGNYMEKIVYNSVFTNMMKRIYADSEKNLLGYQQHGLLHGKNVVYTGYAKLDYFYEKRIWSEEDIRKLWKIPDGIKCEDMKKVIIAPHHSLSEKAIVKFSTFSKNMWFLFDLARKYRNEISFVLKPHPNLRSKAVEEQVFESYEAYDAYIDEWNSLPNARVVQEDSYLEIFETSDGMILDSVSFLAEYMYVNKPLLFLTGKGQAFNALGKSLLEGIYTVNGEDFAGMEEFLQDVLLDGNDILKEKRTEIFTAELDYMNLKKCSASESVYNDIISVLV